MEIILYLIFLIEAELLMKQNFLSTKCSKKVISLTTTQCKQRQAKLFYDLIKYIDIDKKYYLQKPPRLQNILQNS